MKKKLLLFLILPMLLLVFLMGIFLIRVVTTNFTLRMFYYDQEIERIKYEDNDVTFDVFSKDNYFGILSVTSTINLIPSNAHTLHVSFKNQTDGSTIVNNSYKAFDISNMPGFSFGLPVQDQSKNKWYTVQLMYECDGLCKNFIFPSQVIMRHYFPKELFIRDPFQVIAYIQKKLISSIHDTSFPEYLQIFIIPIFLYYLTVVVMRKKILNEVTYARIYKLVRRYFTGDIIIIGLAVLDAISQQNYLFLAVLILILIKLKKIQYSSLLATINVSFMLVLLFLIMNLNDLAIRYGSWLFIMVSYALIIQRMSKEVEHVVNTRSK